MRFRLAALLAVGCLLPSCRPSAADPNELVIQNAEPQTLDPGIQKGSPEHHINIAQFEGLTTYDPKTLEPKPGVAESWELSADGSVYTFKLRPAKWSNGEPLTAADFEWAWKRVLDPATGSEYFEIIANYLKNGRACYLGKAADGALAGWGSASPKTKSEAAAELPSQVAKRHEAVLRKLIAEEKDAALKAHLEKALKEAPGRPDLDFKDVGVTAKDERTLVVTLETPIPFFLELTCFFTYYPVNRAAVEKSPKEWSTRPETFVCNGAFRLKEWKVKDRIILEKNPHYWNAAAVPGSTIRFLPIDSQGTAFNQYEQQKIHWLTMPPTGFIEELKKRPDFFSGPQQTTYFYGFNVNREPFKDKRVRQALSRAIDREKITANVTKAGETAALGLVPPSMPGYTSATTPGFDPEAARKLLAEAGFPGGKGFPKVELLYNTLESHKLIASSVQEMWRTHLGIEVDLRNLEWKIYLDHQSRMDFAIIRRAWVADFSDPSTFLDMFTKTNGNNNTGWSNADYDRLVQQAQFERDVAKRMALLKQAEAILMDELPILPVYFYVTKNLLKPRVEGFHDNLRDTHPLRGVHLKGAQP
jgi:oligopeptide transport system substrate-binding protein